VKKAGVPAVPVDFRVSSGCFDKRERALSRMTVDIYHQLLNRVAKSYQMKIY